MSVRFSSANYYDRMSATFGAPLSLSQVSIGMWVYLVSTGGNEILFLGDTYPPAQPRLGFVVSGGDFYGAFDSSGNPGTYTPATGTWYWVVLTHDDTGTVFRVRIFDDHPTNTTPLSNLSRTDDSDTYTVHDTVLLGEAINNGAFDGEITNLKIQTGVIWTDAECRTEALLYGVQKNGGTNGYCWRMKNLDADTDGLYEAGGSGPNLTVGAGSPSVGSFAPTNLSEPSVYTPPVQQFVTQRFVAA